MAVEEFLDDGGTDEAHLRGLLDVLLGVALALVDDPLADVEIVDRLAVHRRRGVVVAVDGLATGGDLRRHLRHEALLAEYALVVGHLQRLHGRRVLAHAAAHVGAGPDGQQVGTHRRQFLADALFRALSDRHHDDDGGHADDDAQHRQERPHLVVGQSLQAYFK